MGKPRDRPGQLQLYSVFPAGPRSSLQPASVAHRWPLGTVLVGLSWALPHRGQGWWAPGAPGFASHGPFSSGGTPGGWGASRQSRGLQYTQSGEVTAEGLTSHCKQTRTFLTGGLGAARRRTQEQDSPVGRGAELRGVLALWGPSPAAGSSHQKAPRGNCYWT